MPLHVHPAIRAREHAEEGAGLVTRVDSVGYTEYINAVNSSLIPKFIHPVTFLFVGKSFTAS